MLKKKLKQLMRNISIFEILLGVVFLMLLGWIMLQTRSKKEWVKVEVKIASPSWWQAFYVSPPYWLGESVQIGDKEFDSRGKAVAEVLRVRVYEISTIEDQQPTRKNFYLTLNLQVSKDKKTKKLKFKNQPLEVGTPIKFHLANTYVSGLITLVEGLSDERKIKEIVINGVRSDTFPWIAEAIQIGGKMRNEPENVIAEILEKRIELAKKTVKTWDGRLVVGRDPLKRDVYLKIKLLVKEKDENLYLYEDQKIKIGENIFIQLPEVDIGLISITDIFDSDNKGLH